MKIKTFYTYFRSSTSYRIRIALNLKGIVPETTTAVNLRLGEQRKPEFLSTNPMGAVPAMELEDGTLLTQSLAILEWLDETFPAPALLPKNALLKAQIRAFSQIISCDTHPVNNLRILNYLSAQFQADDAQKKQWIHHWVHAAFPALESQISKNSDSFCFGEAPTMADICLVPQWYNAERFNVDLSAYPVLAKKVSHCLTQPAFIAATPESQPDCNL